MCNDLSIHRTTTEVIEAPGGGWEYACPECGYLARYWQKNRPGASRLEILNIGDAKVRHISSAQAEAVEKENSSQPKAVQAYGLPWLTPESLRWLEETMRRMD